MSPEEPKIAGMSLPLGLLGYLEFAMVIDLELKKSLGMGEWIYRRRPFIGEYPG
jgi:hypothetical protein